MQTSIMTGLDVVYALTVQGLWRIGTSTVLIAGGNEQMTKRIAELEVQRERMHEYVLMKLQQRDYHGVADAAMDLRELEVEVKLLRDQYASKSIDIPTPLGKGSFSV